MNLKKKIVASLVLGLSASMAQATTFNVAATFIDGGIGPTTFDGSFDWDGTTMSNFSGFLNSDMYVWYNNAFDSNGNKIGGTRTSLTSTECGAAGACLSEVYDKNGAAAGLGYANGEYPLLHLTQDQLVAPTVSNGLVTATVFLQNTTDVVAGGGYNVIGNAMAYGYDSANPADNTLRNNNGFFTLVFDAFNPTAQETRDVDPTDPTAGTFQTSTTTDEMIYADMTRLGMMGDYLTGWTGMTGHKFGGSMGGMTYSLDITCTNNGPCSFAPPAAVPVPAAAWLFGGGLLSLFGASRRKSAMPA